MIRGLQILLIRQITRLKVVKGYYWVINAQKALEIAHAA